METTMVYRGYIGIMAKKLEASIVHWGSMLDVLAQSAKQRVLMLLPPLECTS